MNQKTTTLAFNNFGLITEIFLTTLTGFTTLTASIIVCFCETLKKTIHVGITRIALVVEVAGAFFCSACYEIFISLLTVIAWWSRKYTF
jgi:hypothetical protein